MNYKKLVFQNLSIAENVREFLAYHQDQYIHNVLSQTSKLSKETTGLLEGKKKKLTSVISEFLFTEKYDTVFDIIKLKKKK